MVSPVLPVYSNRTIAGCLGAAIALIVWVLIFPQQLIYRLPFPDFVDPLCMRAARPTLPSRSVSPLRITPARAAASRSIHLRGTRRAELPATDSGNKNNLATLPRNQSLPRNRDTLQNRQRLRSSSMTRRVPALRWIPCRRCGRDCARRRSAKAPLCEACRTGNYKKNKTN